MEYSGWKDHVWIIASIIYVGGMLPLYYLYQTDPASRYGLISNVSYLSIAGAMLLFLQFFIGAWSSREPVKGNPS